MYERILVALDGSEPSKHALKHAISIAKRFEAELVILAVVPRVMMPIFPDEGFGTTPISAVKDMAQYQDMTRKVYQQVLEEVGAMLKEKHPEVKFVTVFKEGRPSATIVDQAENDGVDLIVMGSRGIGGYTGWILGSTSRRVVDSCTKPVLIVK